VLIIDGKTFQGLYMLILYYFTPHLTPTHPPTHPTHILAYTTAQPMMMLTISRARPLRVREARLYCCHYHGPYPVVHIVDAPHECLLAMAHPPFALVTLQVSVDLTLEPKQHAVRIQTSAKTVGVTGVEMEALTAASVAALTVYDMCKAVSKAIEITDLRLESKAGGKSGGYVRHQ
jgi:hypothetical protein